MEIDSLLQNVIAGTISRQTYLDNIKKLAQYVKPRGEKEFVLSMDFERILRPFRAADAGISLNLKKIESFIEKAMTWPKDVEVTKEKEISPLE